MAAEIVNLRQARKQKARAEKERQASENRVTFGRSKIQREQEAAETQRLKRDLDGHRRDEDPST